MKTEKLRVFIDSLSSMVTDADKILLIFFAVFVVYKLINYIIEWSTIREVTATVLKKERIYYPIKRKSQYIIFTSEGVMKNVDSVAWLKFNSSDIYSTLEEGEVYNFKVCKFRIRFSSEYPNIISAKKLDMEREYRKGILNII